MKKMVSPVFSADDPVVFHQSVRLLQRFVHRRALLTNNFAVAIAALMHREARKAARSGPNALLYEPGFGPLISTHDLQVNVCDRIYAKQEPFLPRDSVGPIYKPFTISFKGRSPFTNNWRNTFDLQSGLGCDAPAELLMSEAYLSEPRFDCPFRVQTTGECKSPSGITGHRRTCFNPNKRGLPPGPYSDARPRPKLFARAYDDTGKPGFWILEPTQESIVDFIAEETNRVPVLPFAIALYSGSPYLSKWGSEVSRERLEADLYLDRKRFLSIFDPDVDNPFNAALLGIKPVLKKRKASTKQVAKKTLDVDVGLEPLSNPVSYTQRQVTEFRSRAEKTSDPNKRLRLLERATRGHARSVEVLARQLTTAETVPLEQVDGFDLFVTVDGDGHLFEVKTWNRGNFRAQVRHGIAQLYEYRWRNKDILPDQVRLYLVLDRKPPRSTPQWLWEFLVQDRNVLPCWIAGDELKTFPIWKDRLAWINHT